MLSIFDFLRTNPTPEQIKCYVADYRGELTRNEALLLMSLALTKLELQLAQEEIKLTRNPAHQ